MVERLRHTVPQWKEDVLNHWLWENETRKKLVRIVVYYSDFEVEGNDVVMVVVVMESSCSKVWHLYP